MASWWPFASSSKASEPTQEAPRADVCPVDHRARAAYLANPNPLHGVHHRQKVAADDASVLSKERTISSIPRMHDSVSNEADPTALKGEFSSANWVYPSPAQFYAAMERKQHNPRAVDMQTVVPIHNAVNERCWRDLLSWEREVGAGEDHLDHVKLVSFQGKPDTPSPRARWYSLLGFTKPFDRHDWIVDRDGQRIRYVIDFYTGSARSASNIAFFLDVRPALDSFEGVRMRSTRFLQRIWRGKHVEDLRRAEFEQLRQSASLPPAPSTSQA